MPVPMRVSVSKCGGFKKCVQIVLVPTVNRCFGQVSEQLFASDPGDVTLSGVFQRFFQRSAIFLCLMIVVILVLTAPQVESLHLNKGNSLPKI
jgi:hypothetical protein